MSLCNRLLSCNLQLGLQWNLLFFWGGGGVVLGNFSRNRVIKRGVLMAVW